MLFIRFFVPLLCVIVLNSAAFANSGQIKVNKNAEIFSVSATNGPSFICLEQRNRVFAGILSRNGRQFTRINIRNKPKLERLKARLNSQSDANRIKKIRNRLKKVRTQTRQANTLCRNESGRRKGLICDVLPADQNLNIKENAVLHVTLSASTNCDKPLYYELISNPSVGKAYLEQDNLYYHAIYGNSSDFFRARVCHESPRICSQDVNVSINANKGHFAGRNDNITPYRKSITATEAGHLIKKLALNDYSLLSRDVMNEDGTFDLNALVGKMLNPYTVASDLKQQLEIFRDGGIPTEGKAASPVPVPLKDPWGRFFFNANENFDSGQKQFQAFERFQHNFIKGYNGNSNVLSYSSTRTPSAVYLRARYLSPTWQLMTNLWYAHFGTAVHNLGSSRTEYHIRDYMDIIEKNALGSFKHMVIGTNPQACNSEGPGRGILCDPASAIWLSNHQNTYNNRNQNYAREFLELSVLGQYDLSSGEINYSEDDVIAATAYLSGYRISTYQGTRDNGLNPQNAVTREKLVLDNSRHDFNEYTAFKGRSFEISGALSPVEFTEHIFNNHPGMPRYIAGKIFRMLVYRDPSEEFVQELADRFKASNFHIGYLIYIIATSEAMFSDKAAKPGCIKEPIRIFAETFRNIRLPLFRNRTYLSATTHRFNSIGANTVVPLAGAMRRLGEKPLLYDTVFTHDYCGRQPEQFGEEWLFANYLLERTKVLMEFVARGASDNADFFDFQDLLKLIPGTEEELAQITPAKVIEFYNSMYGIDLSSTEYQTIYNYLTTRLDNNDIPRAIGWNATDNRLVNEKLAGLTVIYSSLSQSNIH